jgi:hypothetical protein
MSMSAAPPGGYDVGHAGRAERAEIDGVELRQPLEAVLVQHPLMLQVVLASPRQRCERHGDGAAARRFLDCGDSRRDHFFADAVAGDDANRVCLLVRHFFMAALKDRLATDSGPKGPPHVRSRWQ